MRERWRLNFNKSAGPRGAHRVGVAYTRRNGLGYDIVSFGDSATGKNIYIEVKTTNCDKDFPFYASQCEIDASIELGDSYRLYRVFNFSPAAAVLPGQRRSSREIQIGKRGPTSCIDHKPRRGGKGQKSLERGAGETRPQTRSKLAASGRSLDTQI